MVTVLAIETIISAPEIRSGEPIIAGSQVRVVDIVASHLYRGHNPDELATQFDLNLGQVYAALAYYYQHKAELDARLQTNTDTAEHYINQLAQQGKLIRIE